jgi:Putative beta-barrel porin-2, OmpL-like. bbp2
VQAGIVLGSDVFIDPADTPTAIGSVKWAPPGGRDSVQFSFIAGNGRFDRQRNFHNPEIFDLVWTHKINSRLVYNFEGLYGFTTNVPDTGFANWFGLVNYLTYTFTPRLNGNARLEFFDDPQGQRTGFAGLYSALTLGLNYQPSTSVIFRPEIRYDVNDRSRPFDDRHGLFTAGFDVILRW